MLILFIRYNQLWSLWLLEVAIDYYCNQTQQTCLLTVSLTSFWDVWTLSSMHPLILTPWVAVYFYCLLQIYTSPGSVSLIGWSDFRRGRRRSVMLRPSSFTCCQWWTMSPPLSLPCVMVSGCREVSQWLDWLRSTAAPPLVVRSGSALQSSVRIITAVCCFLHLESNSQNVFLIL